MTTPTIAPTEAPPAPRTQPGGGDGDHDRFSHYVDRDKIVDASVFGEELEALCGKRFIPTRDPSRYQVCPSCQAILESMPL